MIILKYVYTSSAVKTQFRQLSMKFKAKLSKQGNGYCIYVPIDVRTKLDLSTEYDWEVRTKEDNDTNEYVQSPVREQQIIRKIFNTQMCTKHTGSMKGTCGCK